MSSAGEAGVSSGALMMIEQPAASAAPSLRTIWLIGKFHGVKAATGPTGSLTTRLVTFSRARGHDAAIGAPRFLREPIERVGRRKDFDFEIR